MLFTDRKDLADKADQWMEEKHVGKTSLGVISYLDIMGLLKSDNKNDDLIKRQDVIDLLEEWGSGSKYIEVETEGAIDYIMDLPSTQPEKVEVISNYYYTCELPEVKRGEL